MDSMGGLDLTGQSKSVAGLPCPQLSGGRNRVIRLYATWGFLPILKAP